MLTYPLNDSYQKATARAKARAEALATRTVHAEALPQDAQNEPQADVSGTQPVFPTSDQAVELNQMAHQLYGQQWAGVIKPNELDSAINSAQQHYYYGPEENDQERLASAAAKMAYRISMNQPFANGNKRTAAWLSKWFMDQNGIGHVSPADHDDEEFADHLIGYGEGTHGEEDTMNLFKSRLAQAGRQAHMGSWEFEQWELI